jgi:hypothetical protein
MPLGTRTYLLRLFAHYPGPLNKPVDLWTLCRVTNSLENRCHSCICSANYEDAELDVVGDSGEILLCRHSGSDSR